MIQVTQVLQEAEARSDRVISPKKDWKRMGLIEAFLLTSLDKARSPSTTNTLQLRQFRNLTATYKGKRNPSS
jgi:hypothetical protein